MVSIFFNERNLKFWAFGRAKMNRAWLFFFFAGNTAKGNTLSVSILHWFLINAFDTFWTLTPLFPFCVSVFGIAIYSSITISFTILSFRWFCTSPISTITRFNNNSGNGLLAPSTFDWTIWCNNVLVWNIESDRNWQFRVQNRNSCLLKIDWYSFKKITGKINLEYILSTYLHKSLQFETNIG